MGRWSVGQLAFSGAQDAGELEASPAYAYLDGDVLFISVQTESSKAVLRGTYPQAEIIAMGDGTSLSVPEGFWDLIDALGLLPGDCAVELEPRDVPLKLPQPPEDVALDPVLWALVNHPDWLGFARDNGLERVGLRVRVVAEVSGHLDAAFEPYIQSSTPSLVELLIPIPYLADLGADEAAELVRPPHTPHPAGG